MSKVFTDGIKTPFAKAVKRLTVQTQEGEKEFPYLPWALALALADRPKQEIVETPDGEILHPVFGGGVVGIRQFVDEGIEQVTWLPILNGANQAKPEAKITSRDVADTINRCRAKAVAMVNGVGLPLWADGLEDLTVFLKSLNVTPDTDLDQVRPYISTSPKKNGEYIDWAYALAAARITDPKFHWEVVHRSVLDKTTGEIDLRPYFRMGNGWGVAVRVTYKGGTHTETLAMTGFLEVETKSGVKKLDHQPLVTPNCHDWNRSVMRCLTKAIAIESGYGLSVYAKVDDVERLHVEPLQRKSEGAAPHEPESLPEDPAVKAALVEQVAKALESAGRQPASLLGWLGHKDATDLSVASVEQLQRGLKALATPAPTPPPPPAPKAQEPKQESCFL